MKSLATLGGPRAPCKDCAARKLFCHMNCVAYTDFVKGRARYNDQQRTQSIANSNIVNQQIDRYKKK